MIDEGYVSFDSILERVNRDKPDNVQYKIADAKEWLWEAIKKIGGEGSYIKKEELLTIEDGRVLIPNYIQGIRSVKGENNEVIAQTYESLNDDIYTIPKYLINGRYIFTTYTGNKLKVHTLSFPKDSNGNPLVINNIYVISAVVSYLIERMSRKAYMSGKMARDIYMRLESEWLFYVKAANNSINMPSLDSMEDWRILHDMMPGLNDNYQVNSVNSGTGYRPN